MPKWGIAGWVSVLGCGGAGPGCPRPRAAAGEGCPKAHGGPAALDWGFNASEQLGAGFSSSYENSPQTVERAVRGDARSRPASSSAWR